MLNADAGDLPVGKIGTVFNQRGSPVIRPHMSHSFNPVQRDTRAWQYQVWISFAIAVSMCAIGLAWLPGQHLEQAFMVMGYMFCLSAAFVLAKFVRDKQATQTDAGDTPYRDWIETYGGDEYQALCRKTGALIDRAVADRLGPDAQSLPRWQELSRRFTTATRLEAAFWGLGRA